MAAPAAPQSDAERILATARPLRLRDQLLVRLVCLEGLTLHEALRLTAADINGQAASVSTKTGVRRVAHLPPDLAALAGEALAGRREGHLFVGVAGAPLRLDQARKIVLAALSEAGVDGSSLQLLRAQLLAA